MTGVAFHIGGLTIGWYGIMIACGVLATIGIALIEARRGGENTGPIFSMVLLVILLGTIGARLYHVIHHGIGRFFLEGLKLDAWTLWGIPTARWITGLAIIIAIIVMMFRHSKPYQETK
jgi:prolipoprotein diacylglyceryltransferase